LIYQKKKKDFIKTKGRAPKSEINKQEYTKIINKVTKHRKRLCEVCCKEMRKYNSFSNHLNSKKHQALVEIILSTIDYPLCVEL
jgi:predicted AlkP superfamily phosphohydrolase/phosphomutase